MTVGHLVTRFALLTCTSLGCWAVPAHAQTENDDGTPVFTRSPLLNGATPFSQKLPMFEEMGAAGVAGDLCHRATCRCPADCNSSPASNALDNFLAKPLSPAPREQANAVGSEPVAGDDQRVSSESG